MQYIDLIILSNDINKFYHYITTVSIDYPAFITIFEKLLTSIRSIEMMYIVKETLPQHYSSLIKDLSNFEEDSEEEYRKKFFNIIFTAIEQYGVLARLKRDGCQFKRIWFYIALERCNPNFLDNILLIGVEKLNNDYSRTIVFDEEKIDYKDFLKVYQTLYQEDDRLYGLNIKINKPFAYDN